MTLLEPSGVEGNLAITSARGRARHVSVEQGEIRGHQPPGRSLISGDEIGDLLVEALRLDRAYVNNKGPKFLEAMEEWLAQWRRDTCE